MTSRTFKTCTWAVSLAALMLLHAGCKKEKLSFTIKATLLESIRNPKPLAKYQLRAYQEEDAGLFGGITGFEENAFTDASGNIRFNYGLGRAFGLSGDDRKPNLNPIYIRSIGDGSFLGSQINWFPIPPNKDTSLGIIYLYGVVDNLVRKIDFHKSLAATDSIVVLTTGIGKGYRTTVHGPVSAGTMLTLGTIVNYKTDDYRLRDKAYLCTTLIERMPSNDALISKIPPTGFILLEQTIHYR